MRRGREESEEPDLRCDTVSSGRSSKGSNSKVNWMLVRGSKSLSVLRNSSGGE